MKTRRKVIRACVAFFLFALPQLLIWLHKAGIRAGVTSLCLIYAFILTLVFLKLLAVIQLYGPVGIAIYAKRTKTKSSGLVIIGAIHIAYALFKVGWESISLFLLVLLGLAQTTLFIGKLHLRGLDAESAARLWSLLDEKS